MNVERLVGMVLATIGLIVLLIARVLAYTFGLYLGLIVIAIGFVIYIVDVYRVPKKSENKS